MPKLWSETIEAHRREVRRAILDNAARLAGEHGPLNVTMSQIAEETGIGRATLYRYFASVEEILHAWHERQVDHHLALLADIADCDGSSRERLAAVLDAYARIQRHRRDHEDQPHGRELAAMLHRSAQLVPAEQRLHDLVEALAADAADSGDVRSDVPAGELTTYCLHALNAAATLPSDAATQRLVALVLDGLEPDGGPSG